MVRVTKRLKHVEITAIQEHIGWGRYGPFRFWLVEFGAKLHRFKRPQYDYRIWSMN